MDLRRGHEELGATSAAPEFPGAGESGTVSAAAIPEGIPLLRYFLRLGATGFGGPIALVSAMRRDLVQARAWYSAVDFERGLALAQLCPGPLAAQLAMYLGWRWRGPAGALAVTLAFVLPSFLIVLALAWLHGRFGALPAVQAAFYGFGAAVIGILIRGAASLARATLRRDPTAWVIFTVLAVSTAVTGRESVLGVIAGGIVMAVAAARTGKPRVLAVAPLLTLAAAVPATSPPLLAQVAATFASAGTFVFGSGLAIIPFLRERVVEHYGWMTAQQFLDAVAVAMITPGPVVIMAAFIGFHVAGLAGALVASAAMFLPAWLGVVVIAPLMDRVAGRPAVQAFVRGVTAGACGAIAGAVWILGRGAVTDWLTTAIAASTFVAVHPRWRIPQGLTLLAAAFLGLLRNGIAR